MNLCWRPCFHFSSSAYDLTHRSRGRIQLLREGLSEKKVNATIPKGNVGYDQYAVPDTVPVEPTFVAFLEHAQTYVHGLSCHSFKFHWRTVNSKLPTVPFEIVACTFSDNLSANFCIWTKCKNWKSWLSWAIFEGNISHQKLRNCCVAKKLMSHTFSVKFRVFRREFLRSHSVYWAQIYRDNWNCYALSTFRVFILLASSNSDKLMLWGKCVNKDSPV